ncbi:hypothetical protein BDV12DRAFT_175117 [Aspergillus spectabilis]
MSDITSLSKKTSELIAELLSQPCTRLLLAALPGAVITLLIPGAYRDYQSYLALGPGGPPYNVAGWLGVKLVFNPFRRDMLGTGIYDRKVENGERTEFLKDLPQRKGERPMMGTFAVPQRQTNQWPSQEMKDRLMTEYETFLTRNAHIVDRVPSILEKYTDAAHVCAGVSLTPIGRQMKREICHVHGTSDHSVHVTLAPADCKRVIEAGWGQRFPLSGSNLFKNLTFGRLPAIPQEYIFVYAPRAEVEIQIVMQIIKASVQYVTESSDVR